MQDGIGIGSIHKSYQLSPPGTSQYIIIHAEHVVQSAWILFSLWMYVCMYVSALERNRLIGMTWNSENLKTKYTNPLLKPNNLSTWHTLTSALTIGYLAHTNPNQSLLIHKTTHEVCPATSGERKAIPRPHTWRATCVTRSRDHPHALLTKQLKCMD